MRVLHEIFLRRLSAFAEVQIDNPFVGDRVGINLVLVLVNVDFDLFIFHESRLCNVQPPVLSKRQSDSTLTSIGAQELLTDMVNIFYGRCRKMIYLIGYRDLTTGRPLGYTVFVGDSAEVVP